MTEKDWVTELEGWLQNSFVKVCKAIGQPIPFSGLRISPPLSVKESKYFLLGLEADLFQPDEFGYVRSPLLPRSSGENDLQKRCRIFWHDSLPPRLIREAVCQLSTASRLILERGWLASHVELEPGLRSDHEVYGIDILVRSPSGRLLAGVEIKRTVAELQKLVTDLRACCNRGPHDKDQCGFPQNHPNYEFCASYRPTYLWAVAPDADVCFRIHYKNAAIALEQLPSLPPRSMIELE